MPLAFNTSLIFAKEVEPGLEIQSQSNLTTSNGNGLVSIPNQYATKHHLPLSDRQGSPGHTIFQVDVFHQLQCLDLLRNTLTSSKPFYHLDPASSSQSEHTMGRMAHCLDYLSQAVSCHSDMTLLSLTSDLDVKDAPPRQCRDSEAVKGWTDARRYEYDAKHGNTER
jgi:hypothetical protein